MKRRRGAYYNENDKFCAEWLRNLIKAKLIAPGVVDDRSIEEVAPSDLEGFAQCHFFAGIGVWSYALRLAGWPDDRPAWTGSCPCQPWSVAQTWRRGGFSDPRHLWPSWYRLIAARAELDTFMVFGEQVASPEGLAWLDRVCADLERADYAVGAVDICAASVAAPGIRQRLYFMADSDRSRSQRHREHKQRAGKRVAWSRLQKPGWKKFAGSLQRFPSGPSVSRVGRMRAYGNALNAEQAAAFIRASMGARSDLRRVVG